MPIEIEITSGSGRFAGLKSNITSYSQTEEATPLAAGDSSGGVGTLQFGAIETPESPWLQGAHIDLRDTGNGLTRGIVRNISSTDGPLSVNADSIISLSNVTRYIAPFDGTLGDAFEYYLSLVDITTDFLVDISIASRPVVFPGGNSDVWLWLKQMCVAQQVEIALVYGNIVLRPARANTSNIVRATTLGWAIDSRSAARTVEVNYYNSAHVTDAIVYPVPSQPDPSILQVDANEELAPVIITLDTHLSSVNQPTQVTAISPNPYTGTTGQYVVVGNDGLPIPPAQWTANGGSLTVEIGEQPNQLIIRLKGSSDTQYAPFRIAESSGDSTFYSALYITGDGTQTTKDSIILHTGASEGTTQQLVGVTVDNPLISTRSQAATAGLLAVNMYAGTKLTMSGTAVRVNRAGSGGQYAGPTIALFNANTTGDRPAISDFNTYWTGKTFSEFNDYYNSLVTSNYDNQQFGNAAGSRIRYRDAYYRMTSATITQEALTNMAAIRDTIIADHNETWDGQTIAEWNAEWAGRTFNEYDVRPLMP